MDCPAVMACYPLRAAFREPGLNLPESKHGPSEQHRCRTPEFKSSSVTNEAISESSTGLSESAFLL